MAARRVRIKGIANIPVRRKNEVPISEKVTQNDVKEKPTEKAIDDCTQETKPDIDKVTETLNEAVVQKNDTVKLLDRETDIDSTTETNPNIVKFIETATKNEDSVKRLEETNLPCDNRVNIDLSTSKNKDVIENSNAVNNNVITTTENSNIENEISKNALQTSEKPAFKPIRRWIPKPSVKLPVIPRKLKLDLDEPKKTEDVIRSEIIKTPVDRNFNDTKKTQNDDIISYIHGNETDQIISQNTLQNDAILNDIKPSKKDKIIIDQKTLKNDGIIPINSQEKLKTHENINNVTQKPLKNDKITIISQKIIKNDDIQLIGSEVPKSDAKNSKRCKNDSETEIHKQTDTMKSGNSEGLVCPLSPSKTVNRARIRPVPRLIRRNSVQGSASESEDDGRKSHRTRNDSVCSITSFDAVSKDEVVTMKEKKFTIISQRKVKYTEQSRKIATARREFQLKFGSDLPDRKKLTMMDLIFYNPTTNPMPEKPAKSKDITEIVEVINPEQEDDPDEPGDQGSDEENIPVPQVKVGPDGEIILDEQSLVIEQTGTKKGREQLANSQIVIDDLDTGYGIYKRPKKSKDWSMTETLRFYRTLNTVGTDFSLMLSLFPGRTRRELKLKFKKEEKINRVLIDRVLMNPVDFDLSELEEQFKEEEKTKSVKKEERKPKIKEVNGKKRKRPRKMSVLARQIEDENEVPNVRRRPSKKPKMEPQQVSILKKGIEGIISSDSEEDSDTPLDLTKKLIVNRPKRTCRLNPKNYKNLLESDDDDTEYIVPVVINKKRLNKTPDELDKQLSLLNEEFQKEIIDCVQKNTYAKRTERDTVIKHSNNADTQVEVEVDEIDQMEIETNVVIAHSDNEQPDRISIDIVSKNTNEKISNISETIVSLDFKPDSKDDGSKTNEETNITIPEAPVQNLIPEELPPMEPGSLMILSSMMPNGEKIFKVFMVTPNKENVPVDLSEDIVKSLTTSLGSDEEVMLDLPVITN